MQEAKRRALLFIMIALALATVAGYMFLEKLSSVDSRLGQMVTIYVAKKDIAQRQALQPDNFEAKQVPKQFLPSSVVTDLNQIKLSGNRPLPIQVLTSITPLAKGDLLTANMLKENSDIKDPNKRIILVPAGKNTSFDSIFTANDRVDIIVSRSDKETKRMWQDILVAGVGKGEDGSVGMVALEMTIADAEKFIHDQNFAPAIRILKAPAVKDGGSPSSELVLPKQKEKDDKKKPSDADKKDKADLEVDHE
ncbi:Flp pilus assembly protein CpaB [Baia soyae]|uniref:Flp pilus assembly protein CpaB n=1 Tax=Baia soyae TaxID=1544746 RepID=A0A4R2SDU6_9BACL|nr:hypothetical protein [Baia soyae]TCP69240.1 Flp pilus assembly protein CpaB [Baia soyae]